MKNILSFTITEKNQLDLNLSHLNKLILENINHISELYSYNSKQAKKLNQKLNLIDIDISKNNIMYLKNINYLHLTNRKLDDLFSLIFGLKIHISKMHNKQLEYYSYLG